MYPKEYIQFLVHFNGDRDYFECHEILEEYWKDSNAKKKDSIWVGLILLAVSRYHHRRGNFKGAKRTLEKSINILSLQENISSIKGLDVGGLFSQLSQILSEIDDGKCYQSINLPVTDPALITACIAECDNRGFIWGQESNIANESIVHRHKLRDRSKIIEERQEALRIRKGND